ncbi:hypothetical protein ACWGJ2_08420 [Streptomyces sp. NPDC054796]
MTGFRDTTEPTSRLTPPKPPDEFSRGALDTFNDVSDALSPSAWVLEVYEIAFGFNPVDEIVNCFSGDWESFGRCADAWKNLGKMCGDISTNLGSGNREIDASWHGNAADSAYLYFESLRGKVDDYDHPLSELSAQYLSITHAVYSGAEAAKGVLLALVDDAIITAILLAEGSLLSWTGVGAAVGYGVASVHIARLIEHWGQLTKIIAKAQNAVNGSVFLIQGSSSALASQLTDFPVPGTAYDHPAVPTRS